MRPSRTSRLVAAGPVLAALGLNAVAHGRWLVAAPVATALVAAIAVGFSPTHRRAWLLACAAGGAVLGLGLWAVTPPPPGPIPPVLLSPMAGGLTGVAAYCALTGKREFAWVYAWLLAVLSCNALLTPALAAGLGALAVTSLVAVFAHANLRAAGRTGAVAFLAFVAVAASLTWLVGRVVFASEGLLMDTVYQLTQGQGARLLEPRTVDLPARVKTPLTQEPLFELRGEPPRYLRTGVLEAFDGYQFSTALPTLEQRLRLPGGDGQALELTFLARTGPALPAPAGLRQAAGESVEVRGGWLLRGADLAGRSLALVRGPEVLPPEPPPAGAASALPDGLRAELLPLLDAPLQGAATPRAQAEALQQWLSGSFEYSLDVNLAGEGHPLAVLLRERRPAYCTYFASAMVAALRAKGVPARLVTGFAPEGRNPLTGRTLVTTRDAHAWVEAWLPDEGRWVAFDPTPWRSRDAALGITPGAGWASTLGGAVAGLFRRTWAALRYAPGAALQDLLTSPWTLGAVALAAAWVFGRRRLARGARSKARAAREAGDETLRRHYARYLKLLEGAGLRRAPHETDAELLARLRAARGTDVALAADHFVQAFHRERFRAPERAPLEALLGAVDRALARTAPGTETGARN